VGARSVAGLRVVVTGAQGGIGAASCAALRARGARVCGIDLHADGGEILAADVRDTAAIQAAVDEAARRLGGIDVLVNNAGIGTAQDAGAPPDARVRATLEINLLGAWTTTAAALPHLLRDRGHIVNVASGLAVVAVPYAAAYSASKRGLAAYSDSLRLEYRGRLTVTTVHPGYIRTAIHDGPAEAGITLEGMVNADSVEQAAAALVRACSHRPREISTSRTTALSLTLARHLPRLVETVVWRRVAAQRHARGAPAFLRNVEAEPAHRGSP
jgi:NAD(P)-dependent dehydrogenase (short-subunit alcohol dehydrogenase family)